MTPPVTISTELARELLDVLAGLCGAAIGVANVIPALKETVEPLITRADAVSDRLRGPLAESLADEAIRKVRQ